MPLNHLFTQTYLQNKVSLSDSQSISMIAESMTSSNDIGFDLFVRNERLVDSIIGKQKRVWLLSYIAYNEDIFPMIMPNGKIKTYPGGLTLYGGGDVSSTLDWITLESKIRSKYGSLSHRIILLGKLKHNIWKKDWTSFNRLLLNYRLSEQRPDLSLVYLVASDMLRECNDKTAFMEAITWSSILVETNDEREAGYLFTFGKILYKAGETGSAITRFENNLGLLEDWEKEYFERAIVKMKNGEKLD